MLLDGKTALVTGSTRNIGKAIALRFSELGANVVVHGERDDAAARAVRDACSAHGGRSLHVMADVADVEDVRRMAGEVLDEFDAIDVLVNNAATRPTHAFLEMPVDAWHRVLGVDLHAAFYTSQAFLPGMVERGWGRIINITGMHAMDGFEGRAHVSAAKHGLWGMTKALAKEFGPNGITVNAISPGTIRSQRDAPDLERAIEATAAQIPVRRLGEPEDIAALCALLASNEGGFTTGQMIAVNGGMRT
ncbi:MAG: 3-oxoacyl-ACP reductase FabG [Gammaproteobacteria bacterium]|nr:3-oxoacyl-ACP reductase FabG [Gammaproteobacteria bacterium]